MLLRRALTPGWVLAHVLAAAALFRLETYYLAQGALAGLVTLAIIVHSLVQIVRGLVGDRARMVRGAFLGILYASTMFSVVQTLRAQNRVARARAERIVAALVEYRKAHGTYPSRLGDLVPEFIPSIPPAKDTAQFNTFEYTWNGQDGFLMYVELPPFGRPLFDLKTTTWKYID